MHVIIDSIDKRMTVPAIDYLVRNGYEVHGLCFNGCRPLNPGRLKKIHYLDRTSISSDLTGVLSGYEPGDVLITGNPLVMKAVSMIKPDIRYLIPLQESIDRAVDKRLVHQLAVELGIRVPAELEEPDYPMIVKLNISENAPYKPADRYRIVRSERELREAQEFISANADNLILQEYVDGASVGVSMLLDEQSNLVDFIVHERLLEYPVSGGPSAACRSVVNAELAHAAYRLLRALNWKGIAMVEFKGGAFIEINPRFWGSMPLLFIAKSDFFNHYIKILQNDYEAITPERTLYRPNKIMTYFPQGILSVLRLLRSGKFGKAANGLKTLARGKEGLFRLRNPAPFFRYLKSLLCQKAQ
jgi:predicted ATP-grasp superfamily ATP-dependent carboligase